MAFADRITPAPWDTLSDIGTYWRLLSFEERSPPTWEHFWADHRKYWGVDDPQARKSRPWFWETYTEESFRRNADSEYSKLVLHYKHWNGLCRVGEIVQAVPLSRTKIALSKAWRGSITDHSDLEIELYRINAALFIRTTFLCDIFSYGTVTVLPGSMQAGMGERVGTSRMRHDRSSLTHQKDVSIAVDPNSGRLSIWGARFEVLGRKAA